MGGFEEDMREKVVGRWVPQAKKNDGLGENFEQDPGDKYDLSCQKPKRHDLTCII